MIWQVFIIFKNIKTKSIFENLNKKSKNLLKLKNIDPLYDISGIATLKHVKDVIQNYKQIDKLIRNFIRKIYKTDKLSLRATKYHIFNFLYKKYHSEITLYITLIFKLIKKIKAIKVYVYHPKSFFLVKSTSILLSNLIETLMVIQNCFTFDYENIFYTIPNLLCKKEVKRIIKDVEL